jgi:triacylglycerol lipase
MASMSVHTDTRTRYPIVLVHGMMGFSVLKLGWLGELPYWNGIDTALRAGGADVHVVQVSAFNTSEMRGDQLLQQIETIRRATGAEKVHLIGHSHGSQTSRYAAGQRPGWVASVTSVAGPNLGSEFGDWMQQQVRDETWAAAAILWLGRQMARLIDWASDTALPQSVPAALASLHSEGAADFNRRYPAGVPTQACAAGAAEVQGVRYFSWSGVGTLLRWLNPADPIMALTGLTFRKEPGDGLVGRCASHLGEVIADDLPMNHFHAVNQIGGLVDPSVDVPGLFVAHAVRLKALGL